MFNRAFLTQIYFFGSTQVLGLLAALRIKQVVPDFAVVAEPISVGKLVLYLAIATAVFLVLIRLRAKLFRGRIIRALFWFTLAIGLLVFWESFLPSIAALVIVFGLLWWRAQKPSILNHNIAVGLASAGVGAILGIGLKPTQIIVLLVIISIYDVIAVYKTKHMVKIAKAMIEEQAVLALILPEQGGTLRAHPGKVTPGHGFMILGAGDLVFPLLMIVSVGVLDLIRGLVVLGFSLLGFMFLQFIFHAQRQRRAMPALPPLALAVIIGYFVSSLI